MLGSGRRATSRQLAWSMLIRKQVSLRNFVSNYCLCHQKKSSSFLARRREAWRDGGRKKKNQNRLFSQIKFHIHHYNNQSQSRSWANRLESAQLGSAQLKGPYRMNMNKLLASLPMAAAWIRDELVWQREENIPSTLSWVELSPHFTFPFPGKRTWFQRRQSLHLFFFLLII